MPPAKPLSKLERVPLREAWKHEAGDFTPWLAEAANLDAPDQRRLRVEWQVSNRSGAMGFDWCHKLWHKPYSRGRRWMRSVGSIVQRPVGRLTLIQFLWRQTPSCGAGCTLTPAPARRPAGRFETPMQDQGAAMSLRVGARMTTYADTEGQISVAAPSP